MPSFLERSRFNPEAVYPHQHKLENGCTVQVHDAGIIEFIPPDYQPTSTRHVLLSCGVHGNETAPIEICSDLVEALLSEQITPQVRVQFQFANLPAMNIAKRFVTENMNRLFDGAHKNGKTNPERERAAQLEQCTKAFFADCNDWQLKYHYDLHTAIRESNYPRFAVYPFMAERGYSQQQLQWLASAGIQAILLSHSPTTTYSYFTVKHCHAHAFTVELGKVNPFGQNRREDFAHSEAFLRNLLIQCDYDPTAEHLPVVFDIAQSLNKTSSDYVLSFADDTPNFTAYKRGTVLATATDESGKITEFPVIADEEAIVFPNANVEIGQRALLTVTPITLEQLAWSE